MSEKFRNFIKDYLKESDEQKTISSGIKLTEDTPEQRKYFDIILDAIKNNKGDYKDVVEAFKKISSKNALCITGDKSLFDEKTKSWYCVAGSRKLNTRDIQNNKDVLLNALSKFGDMNTETQTKIKTALKFNQETVTNVVSGLMADNKFSFQNAENDWEKFGKILAYKTCEFLNFTTTDKAKTTLKGEDLLPYMQAAFTTEHNDYLKQIGTMDQKLDIDATAGVLEGLKKRGDTMSDSYEYFKNFVDNMLNEDNIKQNQLDINEFLGIAEKNPSDKYVKDTIDKVKKTYKNEFTNCREKLLAAFERGRQQIIEDEKGDKVKEYKDPVTGKVEKRVGRLGHHGPMTYIKNHEDLNNVINKIDGQKWNIFNCAAKLLIKLFKLMEHGSKKWDELMQEIHAGVTTVKESVKNEKQKDFIKDMDEVMKSDESVDNKAIKIIELASLATRKYIQNYVEGFETTKEGEVLVYNTDEKKLSFSDDAAKILNTNLKNLGTLDDVLKYAEQQLAKLDEEKKHPKQHESFISEEDETLKKNNDDIEKQAQEVHDDAKKDAEKKEEQPKEEKHMEDWRKQKFNFTDSTISIDEFDASEILNALTPVAEKIQDEKIKNAVNSIISMLKMFDNGNDPHILNNDEACVKTVTAEEFFNLGHKMCNGAKNITLEGFKDVDYNVEEVEGVVSDDTAKKAGGYGQFLIGQEKKETEETNTQDLSTQLVAIQKDIAGTDKQNVKAAIEDIKKRRDAVLKEFQEFVQKRPNFENGKNAVKAGKMTPYQLRCWKGDEGPSEKTHIIPCIWHCVNFLITMKSINDEFHIYENKMEDAKNNAIKLVNACVPADVNSPVYKMKDDEWNAKPYKEFVDAINNIVKVVANAKDKITDEMLKPTGFENVDGLVSFLTNNENDPLLKLEYVSGMIVDDADEAANKNEIVPIAQQSAQITNALAIGYKEPEKVISKFDEFKNNVDKLYNEYGKAAQKTEKEIVKLGQAYPNDLIVKLWIVNRYLYKNQPKKESMELSVLSLDLNERVQLKGDATPEEIFKLLYGKFIAKLDGSMGRPDTCYGLQPKQFIKDYLEFKKQIIGIFQNAWEKTSDEAKEEMQEIAEDAKQVNNTDPYKLLCDYELLFNKAKETKEGEKEEGSQEGTQTDTANQKETHESLSPFQEEFYKYIRG